MHSLTPATPPTTDLSPPPTPHCEHGGGGGGCAAAGRGVRGGAGSMKPGQHPLLLRPPSSLSLTWKYSTHSPAFKVRSHTPARPMTHADYHHHHHHRRHPPPPPPRRPSGVGWLARSLARSRLLHLDSIERHRAPVSRPTTLCGSATSGMWDGDVWDEIEFWWMSLEGRGRGRRKEASSLASLSSFRTVRFPRWRSKGW